MALAIYIMRYYQAEVLALIITRPSVIFFVFSIVEKIRPKIFAALRAAFFLYDITYLDPFDCL